MATLSSPNIPSPSPSPTAMRCEEDEASLPEVQIQATPPFEDIISTVGDDFSDTTSIFSLPDKNALGWDNFRVHDQDTKTVYECWEMISVRPTIELRTASQILGVNFYSTFTVLKDGYTGLRAVPSYSQDELKSMVSEAEREYNASGFKLRCIVNTLSYAQDLAERLFALPGCLPNKLGALIDSRFVATNKSQFTRRDWKIVLLMPLANVMTDAAPKNKRQSVSAKLNNIQEEPVQKWLVVLRGQETKTSEEGFEAFDTSANPWLKVDEKLERDHAEAQGNAVGRWVLW
ncbi:hypothetical protein F5X99DRAFT_367640 [Biscogniauxia marginata]|nr:hypothetical protein F5X99DRAFT_367640 [Biscogniauxia marginata]